VIARDPVIGKTLHRKRREGRKGNRIEPNPNYVRNNPLQQEIGIAGSGHRSGTAYRLLLWFSDHARSPDHRITRSLIRVSALALKAPR
jgi:hypothetical protein